MSVLRRGLNRHRRLDGLMRLVVLKLDVVHSERVDTRYVRIEPECRGRERRAGKLLANGIKMVLVDVRVAQGVHELVRF